MSNQWKTIRFGVLLFALPLVATAAASAHQWIVESSPSSIKVTPVAVASSISMERVHTVALNSEGVIEGRIATIDGGTQNTEGIAKLKIYFVQDGTVVKESFTQTDGTFEVKGLPEGDYSFVASGQNGYAAYGVRVITDQTGQYSNVMEVAAVSKGVTSIQKIINDAAIAITDQDTTQGEVAISDFEGANQVKLVEGKLQGRVMTMTGSDELGKTVIHIARNNETIAEVQADETGSFVVPDLEPGVYDFVAVGPSGIAVLAFEAVDTQNVEAVGDVDADMNPETVEMESATSTVATVVPKYATTFNVLLIEPQDAEPALASHWDRGRHYHRVFLL